MVDKSPMNANTVLPSLYTVHNAQGDPLAYCAHVQTDDEGRLGHGHGYWFAGSASGPVTGHIRLVDVGTRFEHHAWGLVEVAKVNRKTVRLSVLDPVCDAITAQKIIYL